MFKAVLPSFVVLLALPFGASAGKAQTVKPESFTLKPGEKPVEIRRPIPYTGMPHWSEKARHDCEEENLNGRTEELLRSWDIPDVSRHFALFCFFPGDR